MSAEALAAHLRSGATTVCRAWKVVRRDGVVLGFTDHDLDLSFDGVVFAASTGLSARALQQSTGLSVDNSEALGALSDAAVREEDIAAGRFDDAEVTAYLVNWQVPEERQVLFRGNFGEITRERGAFRVELRGLAERLNVPVGRAYVSRCDAQFGDTRCGINLDAAGRQLVTSIISVFEGRELTVALPGGPAEGSFSFGRLEVLDGAAFGLHREIRADTVEGDLRRLTLWQAIVPAPVVGDRLRLVEGCDKRASTCRVRFDNILNFRGFPHIPGDDWLRRPPEVES